MFHNLKKSTIMEKLLDYQMDMHTNVLGVCNKNQALLATILVYVASKLKLDTNVANENELAALLAKLDQNTAVPKNLARTAASTVFLDLSINLSSYAWNKGDMKLYFEVKFTKTLFKTFSDSEFVRICGNLLTTAGEYIEELADRNITEQTLTDDSALLEDFVSQRQIYVDTRRAHYEATAQLKKQIKTTNFDLKSIDTIIDSLSQSQPVVASDYWKARNMPVPTGSKLVFKGKAYDAVTNQPLPGTFVTITQVSNTKALSTGPDLVKNVKIKSAGGGFQLKSLPNGNYLVTASYYGYADYQVLAYVNEGVLTIVELPLTRVA
jgi:uncharacterized protein (UPF0147 family)